MAGRLTRFMNLEKARKPSGDEPEVPVTAARFSGEEAPPQQHDFAAERAAQVESGVEIEKPSDAEQPFLRCPVCEADNSKFAAKCINCQSRLDTDAVHAWNAKFWQERRAQAAAQPAPPQVPLVEQNRMLGEALAREVAEREKMRMGMGMMQGWSYSTTPLGFRLLELIGNPNARFAVAMALVAVFFGAGTMAYVARHHPVLQTAGIVVAVALLVLFTPNRSRYGRRWWDDW